MKRLILGSVMGLLLMSGPVAAECVYHGVPYSEGARVCMHRTMFMCRGERWVKTAERCWERYFTQASALRQAVPVLPGAVAVATVTVTACEAVATGARQFGAILWVKPANVQYESLPCKTTDRSTRGLQSGS